MSSSEDYASGKIQVLEGLEAVQKRPGMYIGSTDHRGLHHLVFEVVDNSIDEALAGFCSEIAVTINEDNSVTVRDNGRGIPVGEHPKYGVSGVEVVMTRLHAGGKFDSSSYEISGGLHGVGVSVVNALSEWLEIEVHREGKSYHQRFEKGKPTGPLEETGETEDRGTIIRFKPDPDVFETDEFKSEPLVKKMRELAYLNKGLLIKFKHLAEDIHETFHYHDGIQAFTRYLNRNYEPLHEEVIYFSDELEDVKVQLAMQYAEDAYTERIFAFANNINTHEGGTHVTGFKTAITRVINNYAEENNLLDGENLKGEDIREGLTVILSVLVPEPQFEGQTKTKLGNSEVRGIVETVVNKHLTTYLEEHPSIAQTIIERVKAAAQARKAAQKAKQLTRRKSVLQSSSLPGKLADCSSRDPEKSELFVVEGDSAGGSAKQGRDREFQAILPLRGKILNVEKARIDRVLDNKEIRALITALGTGVGEEDFDLDQLRYGKIIIMTDADVDGAHIRTLLMTLFFRYMREIIEAGHLYIAQPPLYQVSANGTKKYVYREHNLPPVLEEFDGNASVQRYKGLGEMNPDQLLRTTMDPENRTLLQVQVEDAVEADELFTTLMGDDVGPRRQFIEEHADDVRNLDV